jgi:hypothetical protein
MNAIKFSIGVVCAASLSFAQIPFDAVKKNSDLKISKSMTFQHAKVEGNFNNPGITVITGGDFYDTMDLKLNRSFKQELSSNVDKETVERMF